LGVLGSSGILSTSASHVSPIVNTAIGIRIVRSCYRGNIFCRFMMVVVVGSRRKLGLRLPVFLEVDSVFLVAPASTTSHDECHECKYDGESNKTDNSEDTSDRPLVLKETLRTGGAVANNTGGI